MISWNGAPGLRAIAAATHSIFDTRVLLDRAAEITPQAINWIWHGHLAAGKLNLLGGSPGTGKSGIVINLAAAVSRGSAECPLPDGSIPPQGHVVILASEDGVEDTIVPRLIAAGANMEFVHIVRGTVVHGRPRPFGAEDCDKLSAELDKLADVRLVIIDPITQMVRKNGNSNTEVRKALEPLIELAEKHGFAVLGVAHLAKGSQKRSPLERVAGSLAFGALSRIVLLTVRGDAEEDGEAGAAPAPCALVRIKSNIGPDGGGFSYSVRPACFGFGVQQFASSVISWEGRLTGSAKSILEGIEGAGGLGGSSALAKAKAFLVQQLQGGPQPATLIQEHADEARISRATLRRAREDLGVVVERLRNGQQASPWMWSLPGSAVSGAVFGTDTMPPVGPMPPMGPIFPTGPFAPGPFNPGYPQAASPFHPAPLMPAFTSAAPMFAPQHGLFPSTDHVRAGPVEHIEHIEHIEHVGRVEQVEHVEQHEQVEHGEENGEDDWEEEEPLITVTYHLDFVDEPEDDTDALLEFSPAVDPLVLSELIEACHAARDMLPEMLKDDDHTLEGIEQSALAKLAPADRTLYRTALNQSDWMFH